MSEPMITEVTQIGIITADLDRAVRAWADRYGVGPWQIYKFDPSNMTDMEIGGAKVDYGMRLAITFVGGAAIGWTMS